MRKITIAALLFSQVANAQLTTTAVNFPLKGQLVTVNDWGSRSLFILSEAFFDATKDSIILQIGQQEFDEMQTRCSVSGWPEGFHKSGLGEEEDKAFDATLSKLRMYKIASYTHIYNGKTFDRYVILRVPFEENKTWDPAIQWEGSIYFLLKEKVVEVVK